MNPTHRIEIVYQSAHILAIHKPAGLPFHKRGEQDGVMQVLRAEQETLELGSLYPVHRLDTVTSGLLLLARDRDTARQLGAAFAQGLVEKQYLALSQKKPSKKQGCIIGDMVRSRRGTWKLTRGRERPAITQFVSTPIPDRRPGLRLYLLQPKTGRTHQLRVAMRSLGAPILGDPLYAPSTEAKTEDRTYLHAFQLRFTLAGESIDISCMPKSGKEFLSEPFLQSCRKLLH